MPRFPMNMPRAGTATISPYGSTRFRRGIVGSHDVGEKRLHLAGEPFDLPVALLVWPDQIHDDVAYARLVEGAHLRGHVLRPADGGVALRRLAEVHRIARAERLVRRLEGALVAVVDPREQEMRGIEALERDRKSTRMTSSH